MADKVMPGPVQYGEQAREAVCIHTKKIFDSCKDKDCIDELRFYPACDSQAAIDQALSIKSGRAELIAAYIDVEPVGFNRGFFTVDVRFFYRVTAFVFIGAARPVEICGLCVFDKRAILFGSDSAAKVFTSDSLFLGCNDPFTGNRSYPTAIVEAVDPIVLNIKLADFCDRMCCEPVVCDIPPAVAACFGGELYFGPAARRVYVTLGQFSIIRLERDANLLIPAFSYCVPDKECSCGGVGADEDPCAIFSQIEFPTEEFFPPSTSITAETYTQARHNCGC